MTYRPRKSADEIAAGMSEWLKSLGQYGAVYGSTYGQFQKELAAALRQSDKCAALQRVRKWIKTRNREARLEMEGKFGQAIKELGDAERDNCGG